MPHQNQNIDWQNKSVFHKKRSNYILKYSSLGITVPKKQKVKIHNTLDFPALVQLAENQCAEQFLGVGKQSAIDM